MSSSKYMGLCGRCISEFIDCRYSQSCWYFRPNFVNCCPSNLLSGSTLPPPPFPLWISILYTLIHCVRGGYGDLGIRQINTCRKIKKFRWRHFALPSMSLIFLQAEGSLPRPLLALSLRSMYNVQCISYAESARVFTGCRVELPNHIALGIPWSW